MNPLRHKKILYSVALLVVALFAGCSSTTSRKVVDLAPFKHIFVIHRLGDDHHMDELFVSELQRLGHQASSGPRTLLPENADAVLTYEDRWEWDFKTYLIEVTLELHTARTNKKLADGATMLRRQNRNSRSTSCASCSDRCSNPSDAPRPLTMRSADARAIQRA